MKTLKPTRLGVVTRPFEVNKTFRFGVSTFVFFDFVTGEILPEVAMWLFAAEQLGKDAGLDAGFPKQNAELIVTGSAFLPGGEPAETCPVKVRVGALEKTIYVVGDRFWKGNSQSKPQPFATMPLTWEKAFGGAGYAKNPRGKGFAPVETEHGLIQFLPNLELPGKMITKKTETPEPAGLGPIDITWPQRFSKVGTYDQKWLKELFPGFAQDIDWTIHNIASADQQQKEPFAGTESIEVMNMHPSKPLLEGRLPGVRARTFVTQRTEREDRFLELNMRLTTVWLFPHETKGILVFHSSLETSEDDASDVIHLMIAAEALGQDKGVAHYQDVLAKRLDKEKGLVYSLRDQDLLPPGATEGETQDEVAKMRTILEPEGILARNLKERTLRKIEEVRAAVAAHGLDPDLHAPKVPPAEEKPPTDLTKLPDFIEQKKQEAKKAQEEAERISEEQFKAAEPKLIAAGIDPEKIRAEMTGKRSGPPDFTADAEIARVRGMAELCRSTGLPVPELEQWENDEALHQKWRDAEAAIRESYALTAHMQWAAPQMAPEQAERARAEVMRRYLAGESFAHYDLTGADLSGMDLRGADFRKGWLESTNLRGANLEGANFSGAVLTRADLSGAVLQVSNFSGANLGGAKLHGVIGKRIDLKGAILAEADLKDVDLSDSDLCQVEFTKAKFESTKLQRVKADELTFYQTDLQGMSFAGSTMARTSFVECNVSGADFSDTELEAVTFVKCRGTKTKFFRVKADKLTVLQSEPFPECDFRGLKVKTLNLRGVDLRESDFSGAELETADLSGANLRGTKFYRAVAKECLFIKTDFRDADLTSINLTGANLQKADIRGTKLLGANLYAANFGRVHSDENTILTDSIQTKVTIYPLRER